MFCLFKQKKTSVCTSLLGDGTREQTSSRCLSCWSLDAGMRDAGKWWHHSELHGSQRWSGPGQQQDRLQARPPARLHVWYRLGTAGLRVAGQEGKAINISLLHLGGSQMKHSCHKGETLSTVTVTREDVKQLHKANVENSTVWVSCI